MQGTLSKALIDYPEHGEHTKDSNKNAVNAMSGTKNGLAPLIAFTALLLKDFYLDRVLLKLKDLFWLSDVGGDGAGEGAAPGHCGQPGEGGQGRTSYQHQQIATNF